MTPNTTMRDVLYIALSLFAFALSCFSLGFAMGVSR